MSEEYAEPQRIFFRKIFLRLFLTVCALLVAGSTTLWYFNTPPDDFPIEKRVHIPAGSTLSQISAILKNHQVIRSGLMFRGVILSYHKESSLHAGEYLFHQKNSLLEVAQSFIADTALIPPVKVTIPEGSTLEEIDRRLSSVLPAIQSGDIVKSAQGQEGVLFPDTYLLEDSLTADQVVAKLRDTFAQKLVPFESDLAHDSLTKQEIIVLASILEKEANDANSMHMVSGILRKRLEKHMPLQVDATFAYLLHKTSSELTPADLAIDSPFNTYTHKGLPPTPIASPGSMAIEAALHPQDSSYFFYLTDKEGVFHYAVTFDEHKKNKARYLR